MKFFRTAIFFQCTHDLLKLQGNPRQNPLSVALSYTDARGNLFRKAMEIIYFKIPLKKMNIRKQSVRVIPKNLCFKCFWKLYKRNRGGIYWRQTIVIRNFKRKKFQYTHLTFSQFQKFQTRVCFLGNFKSFVPNAPFLNPPKILKNLLVFWCFQGVEKKCIGNKWLKLLFGSPQSFRFPEASFVSETNEDYTRIYDNLLQFCITDNLL